MKEIRTIPINPVIFQSATIYKNGHVVSCPTLFTHVYTYEHVNFSKKLSLEKLCINIDGYIRTYINVKAKRQNSEPMLLIKNYIHLLRGVSSCSARLQLLF